MTATLRNRFFFGGRQDEPEKAGPRLEPPAAPPRDVKQASPRATILRLEEDQRMVSRIGAVVLLLSLAGTSCSRAPRDGVVPDTLLVKGHANPEPCLPGRAEMAFHASGLTRVNRF
jgi:hypothetical protein